MHHLVHYFDISGLLDEYAKLKSHSLVIKFVTSNETLTQQEIQNYFKIIDYNVKLIDEKLYPFLQHNRVKRGLINILGSAIKSITGNMDSDDNERINSLINTIKQNQNNIAHQINNQYSINKEIITKFETTIKNIEHNERSLYSMLAGFENQINVTRFEVNSLFAKDVLNQLIHLLNVILNIAQDVENSLTFCKLKIIHPSIITNEELLKELLKLKTIYPNELPFDVKFESIHLYKNLLKTKCVINHFEIVYFLSLPLFEKTKFDLFYFIPIPNWRFRTIIPSTKYILKSETDLVPLSSICDKTQGEYLCPEDSRTYTNISCEWNILNKSTFDKCSPIQLDEDQSLEFIPEINQYLGIFPKSVVSKTNCEETWVKTQIQGVFLFEDEPNCRRYISDQLLLFNDTTRGQALLMEDLQTSGAPKDAVVPHLKLTHLRVTKLADNLQPIDLLQDDGTSNAWHVSGTITLYIIVIAAALAYLATRRCQRRNLRNDEEAEVEENPMRTCRLPAGAKF